MVMTHPGLPLFWGLAVLLGMLAILAYTLASKRRGMALAGGFSQPETARASQSRRRARLMRDPLALALVRILFVAAFLLIVLTGFMGTPVAGANLATVLTWNIWWTGLVVAIFFLGSAWCAVCPWNTIAGWLVHRRLWKRAGEDTSLSLQVPARLRNLMPAFFLLLLLTWLELGVDITRHPWGTALIAVLFVLLAAFSLVLFERRAFCRFFCPVGRTIGFYAQLAPVELRPRDRQVCDGCTTLECYRGSAEVDPCPTHLVMGRMDQNTYCLTCLNCVRSCPHDNVGWRLRPPSREAISDARPHWDEAIFIVGLLALALFHGLIMMPFWEDWTRFFEGLLSDRPQGLLSFTLLFAAATLFTYAFYMSAIWLTRLLGAGEYSFRRLFNTFAFATLPIAFTYHIAHNLNHLFREHGDLMSVLADPFGKNALAPFEIGENSVCTIDGSPLQAPLLAPDWLLHLLQSGLMLGGFLIAMMVISARSGAPREGRTRATNMVELSPLQRLPLIAFTCLSVLFLTWLLSQPMTMRM